MKESINMYLYCYYYYYCLGEEVAAMNERTKGDVGGGDEVRR